MLAALWLAAALTAADLTAKAHTLDDLCAARQYQDDALNGRMIEAKRVAIQALGAEARKPDWRPTRKVLEDAVWLEAVLNARDAGLADDLARAARTAAARDASLNPAVAGLVDRARQLAGQPQLYGTAKVHGQGPWRYFAVEDPEHVNERRATMGLPAIDLATPGVSESGLVRLQGLRLEILGMAERDQAARNVVIEAMKAGRQPNWTPVQRVDATNLPRLKDIISMHGWPGSNLVGEDGAKDFWLLVQHADADRAFQQRCLPMLEAAVKAGQASGSNLALLTDRVLVGTGKPQRYGTQFETVDGVGRPSRLEDPAHVDERRKAVGLPPMAEYARQLQAMYGGKYEATPAP